MHVGANGLRVVDRVASAVHGSAIGQVADVVAELQVSIDVPLQPWTSEPFEDIST